MTSKKRDAAGREEKVGARKPYVPPAIISREPLEAMAAVCLPPTGKAFPGAPNPGNPTGTCTVGSS